LNASWRYLVHGASFFNTTCSPKDFWWCILAMVRQKKKHWLQHCHSIMPNEFS
jgi:hypothetical protein